MNQEKFIATHEKQWMILEAILEQQKRIKKQPTRLASPLASHNDIKPDDRLLAEADFPSLYRQVCQHLSLAQSRRYSPYLIDRLNNLVFSAHQSFYQQKTISNNSIARFFTQTFPSSVRQECNWLWLSAAVFYLPLVSMTLVLQFWPELVYTVLTPDMVAGMESMYEHGLENPGRDRGSDSDSLMFGYYIFNNTSIGFRTFASGLLFGVGSIITLVFNGLFIGSVAGHLTYVGYGANFWSFVAGHSAMELTAIVLSGAAGLKLGFSLLAPGRKSRYQALRDAAASAIYIIAGAAAMFFIAAFIEAFWSSSSVVAVEIKYLVGSILWLIVIGYFLFVGKQAEDS